MSCKTFLQEKTNICSVLLRIELILLLIMWFKYEITDFNLEVFS